MMRDDDFYRIPDVITPFVNQKPLDLFFYPKSYYDSEGQLKEGIEDSKFWGLYNADTSPYHFSIEKNL
jgi:hypothetical protein